MTTPATTPYPLTQLYAYLTDGCNLACRHCWLAPRFDRHGQHSTFLDPGLFAQAVEEALPLGLTGVKLTGGEPLMHPHLSEILSIIRTHNLRLTVETNGMLVTAELARQLVGFPDMFISVSIDGPDAKTHEAVRGVEGSYENACQAVRYLVETGIKPQIICSLLPENAGKLNDMVGLAENLGAGSLKFNIVQPTARGETLHEQGQTLTLEEIIACGRYVDTELSKQTRLAVFFDLPMAFRPLGRITSPGGCGRCGILSILGLLPDGAYALCGIGEHIPELVFGRIGKDPLAEVWQGNSQLNQLRGGLPDKLRGICGNCLMWGVCVGSCIAQNYYRSHDLFAPYWFCDEAEKKGLFPASRMKEPHKPTKL
ncbi:MAG TPA: SynChlorMet cassette radical SAM/SPASM protein ScmF [Longilinea sp.]|nr:SynChlorMet cassette radical SAM/SPASM protein ScmF [Longilinea sp.]